MDKWKVGWMNRFDGLLGPRRVEESPARLGLPSGIKGGGRERLVGGAGEEEWRGEGAFNRFLEGTAKGRTWASSAHGDVLPSRSMDFRLTGPSLPAGLGDLHEPLHNQISSRPLPPFPPAGIQVWVHGGAKHVCVLPPSPAATVAAPAAAPTVAAETQRSGISRT